MEHRERKGWKTRQEDQGRMEGGLNDDRREAIEEVVEGRNVEREDRKRKSA